MLSESGFWEIVMVKDAAAAKTVDGKTAEAVFDVAISFLVADEKIASQIKSGLAGLNVFFYPHNQEELVGTNGMESMREPFVSSRVNVILYRERYGNTPWTGVELSAIQDSCLNSRAVLQPNFRLYDRAASYTGANLILALRARHPRIAAIAGRAKCSMFATRRRVRLGSVSRRKVKRRMSRA
jgi:hypothetical protein